MSASCKGEKEPGNTERAAIEERNGFRFSVECVQPAKNVHKRQRICLHGIMEKKRRNETINNVQINKENCLTIKKKFTDKRT